MYILLKVSNISLMIKPNFWKKKVKSQDNIWLFSIKTIFLFLNLGNTSLWYNSVNGRKIKENQCHLLDLSRMGCHCCENLIKLLRINATNLLGCIWM